MYRGSNYFAPNESVLSLKFCFVIWSSFVFAAQCAWNNPDIYSGCDSDFSYFVIICMLLHSQSETTVPFTFSRENHPRSKLGLDLLSLCLTVTKFWQSYFHFTLKVWWRGNLVRVKMMTYIPCQVLFLLPYFVLWLVPVAGVCTEDLQHSCT